MRGNLLRAIPHDIRTPLTSIQGASATILESGKQLEAAVNYQLVADIHENAQWLIRMVENLLSVTRISDGTAAIKKEPEKKGLPKRLDNCASVSRGRESRCACRMMC